MNLSRFVKQTSVKLQKKNNSHCLFDEKIIPDFSLDMFNIDYWQERDAVLGHAIGRGTTWFVEHPKAKLVLRHYYRGGLIGRLLDDQYLFTGLENTRAVQEYLLLAKLKELDLPAPTPVAVKITRQGLIYRGDIFIELIPGAKDLVGILSKQLIEQPTWFVIGKTIKQFHQKNIYHHDLNSHNIMLDDNNKVWLIDFDQGKEMKSAGDWQQHNMQRLLRSFRKEKEKLNEFHWHESHWDLLMAGYNSIEP